MPASGRSEATAASRTREGVGRSEGDRREPEGRARRGWGGVRCRAERCGVGFKGAAVRTKHGDASTAAKERSD
ncbi:hypothetical protein DVK07_18165 [Halorubrum sp. Atlit-26R]|nr:hypothetical protein DVK07_18165 [Halorubrum sp. Atlit-26R]